MPALGFTLKDLSRYQGTTWAPDPADANLYLWYQAATDTTITDGSMVAVLGNHAAYQLNKSATGAGDTNMPPIGSGYHCVESRQDNLGNLFRYSENIGGTGWIASGATRTGASLITFTGLNGYCKQLIYAGFNEGGSYTLRVMVRRISGNTALQLVAGPSGSETYTNITIDGVSTEYSCPIPALAFGTAFYAGIRDPNAAGFGQIEVLQWQVRNDTWDATYLTAGAGQMVPTSAPSGIKVFVFPKTSNYDMLNPAPNVIASPFTAYMSCRAYWIDQCKFLANGGAVYDHYVATETATRKVRVATEGAPYLYLTSGNNWFVDGSWWILSYSVNNGGNSFLRKNLDAAIVGPLNNVGSGGTNWGGTGFSANKGMFHSSDYIMRTGLDDAATQELYVRYLANRVGLVL